MAKERTKQCTCCGEIKTYSNFYKSQSPMYKHDQKLPICKQCVEDIYNENLLHYKDEELDFAETNEAYIHELDMDYLLEHTPFCFVTEDGEWREKGEMGWWGSVSNEKPEDSWKQQFVDYVKSLDENCLVTVVDFHI